MIIKSLLISNYRNLRNFRIELKESTLIIGENNIGKTNLLNALGLIFSNEISFFRKRSLEVDDFNYCSVQEFKREIAECQKAVKEIEIPEVRVEVIMQDFNKDQQAVVGDWFIDDEFKQAKLTYVYQARKDLSDWINEQREIVQQLEINENESVDEFNERKIISIDFPIKYFDYTIFGGNDQTKRADPYFLKMLKMEFLDALRDSKKELIASGDYRLLYRILNNRDSDKFGDIKGKLQELHKQINDNSELKLVKQDIEKYLDKVSLETSENINTVEFQFSNIEHSELLKKISLIYGNNPVSVERNGLGRNNLLYISLILSHLTGQEISNQVFFRLIGLEEPESHLHPHLQSHLAKNIENEANEKMQLLITSHSSQITAKLGLENTAIMYKDESVGEIKSHYVLDSFKDEQGKISNEIKKTIRYLKRYLDVTKSNMFFSRKLILVEGISEQILIPKFFEKHTKMTLEKVGCSIINVQGVAFKHFLEVIQKGYFIRSAVLTDRDTNTRTENRADDLKADYEKAQGVIKVEISKLSTFEKDIIDANKSGERKTILFEALKLTRPQNGPVLQQATGDADINVESFFQEIETRNADGKKMADYKADFATNLLEQLQNKHQLESFNIPDYIKKAFDFIIPPIEEENGAE